MLQRGDGIRLFDSFGNLKNYPISFFPPQEYLYTEPFQEEFRLISEEHFPEIVPIYLISNFGRMWHTLLSDFMSQNLDSKGYCYKPLVLKTGGQRNYRIHRLEGMTFIYKPGCEKLLINHKDGIKNNNLISNLEWATYSENNYHASKSGLISRTHTVKYNQDPNLIINICQDIQDNILTHTQIAKKYNVPLDLISAISQGKSHVFYSKNYTFPEIKHKPIVLTNNQVIMACKYFQNNHKPKIKDTTEYFKNAAVFCGLEFDNRINAALRRLYNGETYKSIRSQYNFNN